MKPEYITDYVNLHARATPSKAAIVMGESSYNWQELEQEMQKTASYLAPSLISQEQLVVALMLPNSWEFVIWYLALLELGHIVMPIDAGYKQLEVKAICQQIKPSLIITSSELQPLFENNATELIVTNQADIPSESAEYKKLRIGAAQQIASLLFTSGTTGQPKAAPYTHANHIWNIKVSSQLWDWTSRDSWLISLPLSHWYGLVMGLSGIIYHGNTMYLHEYPDTIKTLETLSSGKVSMFTHVAGAYGKMATRELHESYDLSAVRVCISGGAPLPPYIWKSFKARFGIEIIEAYGSSETGRIASNTIAEKNIGTPGKPLPGVEVKLAADHELLIKSPGLFPGYYKQDELTQKKYTVEGWWKTGDIAELKDGNIYLKSRTIERINKNGYTIYPRDVEWALLQMDSIKDSFVMGIQNTNSASDSIIYFIIGNIEEKAVMEFCKANMPAAWLPDKILLLPELPRTKSGKPELKRLKALATK